MPASETFCQLRGVWGRPRRTKSFHEALVSGGRNHKNFIRTRSREPSSTVGSMSGGCCKSQVVRPIYRPFDWLPCSRMECARPSCCLSLLLDSQTEIVQPMTSKPLGIPSSLTSLQSGPVSTWDLKLMA